MDSPIERRDSEFSSGRRLWCTTQFAFLLVALVVASVMTVGPPTPDYSAGDHKVAFYYSSSARAAEIAFAGLASDLSASEDRADDHGIDLSNLPMPEADHIDLPSATSDLWAIPPMPDSEAKREGFMMPFANGRVSSLFNDGRRHPAIDLAGGLGSPVVATTARQRVVFAGSKGGYGNAVVTQDDLGRTHLYGHLQSIVAKIGAILDQGQKLGLLGSTGHSTGPHVHYEVRNKAGQHVNPALLLFPQRIVARGLSWGRGHPTALASATGKRLKSVGGASSKRVTGRRPVDNHRRHREARAAWRTMTRSAAHRSNVRT